MVKGRWPPPGGAEASEIDVRCTCALRDGFKHPITASQIRCRMPRRYIGCRPSGYEQIDEFLGRRRLQARLITAQLQDGFAPFLRKAAGEVPAEFLFE